MNNLYLHNIHVDQESKHTHIHDENMIKRLLDRHCYKYTHTRIHADRIGGVIVSVLDLSVVDRGFEPRSGQIKDYTIGMRGFSLSPQLYGEAQKLDGSESG
jgi:hypothetical protein